MMMTWQVTLAEAPFPLGITHANSPNINPHLNIINHFMEDYCFKPNVVIFKAIKCTNQNKLQ